MASHDADEPFTDAWLDFRENIHKRTLIVANSYRENQLVIR